MFFRGIDFWLQSGPFIEMVVDSPGQRKLRQVAVSMLSPSHVSPPNAGTGSLQKRTLVRFPSPQLTEHAPNADHSLQPPSTGHSSIAHASSLTSSPSHASPSCAGGGSLQLRVRTIVPPPHVTSHALQLLQVVQPPSTTALKQS